MFYNVLSKEQEEQLKILAKFKKEFILVGGTAIALQIGHRKSIVFDLFKKTTINFQRLKLKLRKELKSYKLLFEDSSGIHCLVNGVKWTFFVYPFDFDSCLLNEKHFKTPDLLTLAAMKAYALGRRSKWKDYVDLYFLLTEYFSIKEISRRSNEIFGEMFSEKLFRVQLTYFKDVDYTEPIIWLRKKINDKTIEKKLIKIATTSV